MCAQGCDGQGRTAEDVGARVLNPEESEEAWMQLSVRSMEHGVGGGKKAAGNQSRRMGRGQVEAGGLGQGQARGPQSLA